VQKDLHNVQMYLGCSELMPPQNNHQVESGPALESNKTQPFTMSNSLE